jgi:large subunit ribosomal protein L25
MAITLKAQERTVKGKKVKTLRRAGIVPAEVYGNGDNVSIQIAEKDLAGAIRAAGTTNLISLDVDGKNYDVLVKEVVRSLDRKSIVHSDLLSIDKKVQVKAVVPVKLIGESPIISKGGIAVQGAKELEVLCFPDKIPSEFTVDTTLIADFSQILTVNDMEFGEGVDVISNKSTMVAYIAHTRATRETEAAEKTDGAETAETAETAK